MSPASRQAYTASLAQSLISLSSAKVPELPELRFPYFIKITHMASRLMGSSGSKAVALTPLMYPMELAHWMAFA